MQKRPKAGKDVPIVAPSEISGGGRQHRQTQSPRPATVLRLQNLTIVTSMEKGFDLLPEKHSTIAMKVLR